jgi:hypothetical protein
MDRLMTEVANDKGLSPAGSHDFDPTWPFLPPLFQICELADVMNLYVLSRSAHFAFVGKEPFDQLVAF